MIGKTLHGNMLVTSFIGSGAMGSVYAAENVKLPGKRYAIKVLRTELTDDASFQERFFQEAKNQSQLSHPNIVDVIDYFEEGNCYFLVQAYVDGKPLNDIIATEGALPIARALNIFAGILEGLDCAHKHGIVHRDVKPSNVLIDKDDRARITDFGIAIQAGAARMTATGTAVGTAVYMSPEQIVRPMDVDHRSDVYSAGIVLYEMLTGQVPFDGGTEFAIQEQQVNRPTPDPRRFNPNISAGLAQIVFKALEKVPANRFAGCRAFLAAIKTYQEPAQPALPVVRIAVAIGVLLVVAGGTVYLVQRPRADTQPPKTEPPKTEPAAAYALIGSARQALGYYCQNLDAIPGKKEGKRIALQVGDSGQADRFDKQIADLEANAKDNFAQYGANMQSLVELDEGMIKKALSDAASVTQQRWQGEVAADYVQLRDGRPLTQAGVRAHCTPAA